MARRTGHWSKVRQLRSGLQGLVGPADLVVPGMSAPKGMDKDLRKVVNDALSRGWTSRPTREGHIFMQHPDGGTVTVTSHAGSYRNLKNTVAAIKRAERTEEVAIETTQEEEAVHTYTTPEIGVWEPFTFPSGNQFDRRQVWITEQWIDNKPAGVLGWEYRCSICRKDGLMSTRAAGGHYSRLHSDLALSGEPWPTKKTKREAAKVADVVVEETAVVAAVPVFEKSVAVAPKRTDLADRVAALIQEEVASVYAENERLRNENKRLRETLTALASLAAEA